MNNQSGIQQEGVETQALQSGSPLNDLICCCYRKVLCFLAILLSLTIGMIVVSVFPVIAASLTALIVLAVVFFVLIAALLIFMCCRNCRNLC
jgi:hypothetical protein